MARLFIKPDPDVDFYAVFCTNIDDFLDGDSRRGWEESWHSYYDPAPDRFERADEFGSSEYPHPVHNRQFGWDCERFLLHRGTGTAWWLHRADIAEYLRRRSEDESVEPLLEQIEDDLNPVRVPTMDELRARRRQPGL